MNYLDKLDLILKENLTDIAWSFWVAFQKQLEYPIWDKPTSSTGKHHQKEDGRVPDVAEHTYEMLYSAIKIIRLFDITPKTKDCDLILLSIAFHDVYKYGLNPGQYTNNTHDRIAADKIKVNKEIFSRFLDLTQVDILEESVRYHSGRWSTDVKDKSTFNWKEYHPYTFFIHLLDMFSANGLIHLPERDSK